MKSVTILNDIPSVEKQRYDELLNYTRANLPYTLAHPFVQYEESLSVGNYSSAMNHAIDFCEISAQYLSLVLLGMMCDSCSAEQLAQLSPIVNRIDTKRPLSFGDWVNDIFIPLLRFSESLIPDSDIAESLRANILIKKQNIITGNKQMPSFVQIRNEYKGHGTTLSQEIYKGVVFTMESRLWRLLESISPLGEYLLFAPTAKVSQSVYQIKICNGDSDSRTAQATTQTTELNIGNYYIAHKGYDTESLDSAKIINLSPLVWCSDRGYVYVFQTLKDDSIAYISSNESAVTLNTDIFNDNFDSYLQQILPSFDISKDYNWKEYTQLIGSETKRFMTNAYGEKKYNKELFVDRTELSSYFEEFKRSDKMLFPILGEAGQGKTNQLCYWSESLLRDEECVATFSSNNFSNYTLESKIRDIFSYNSRRPIKRLLDRLHSTAVMSGKYVYLIFDAINECLTYKDSPNAGEGALDLYRDIRRLFVESGYTNFKIIFTCRSFTWKHLIKSELVADNPVMFMQEDEEFSIKGFTDEELERAYAAYQDLYQIEDRFEDIDRSIVLRLKDPLMLKIACTNFLGQNLPIDMSQYSSISLFDKMMLDISKSYAGRRQCLILDKISSVLFNQYRVGIPSDSIDVGELKQAYTNSTAELYSVAKDIFTAEGQTVAYGELLNKPERPVLRVVETESMGGGGKHQQIQFIYERFLEYILARTFLQRHRAGIPEGQPIAASVYIETLSSANANVVFMGCMRNAILIDYMATKNCSTIIELAENKADVYEISLLISDVLNIMVRENFEADIFSVIRQLMRHKKIESKPTVDKYNAIKKAIDKNQIEDNTFEELRAVQPQIAPIVKLRQLASITIINGVFQSDYFNEQLYKAPNDPYSLLWEIMCDPVDDVRSGACLYIYYLSNLKHTLGFLPIKDNLTERIVIKIYDIICQTSIASMALSKSVRERSVTFLEAATRLCVILIIDSVLTQPNPNYERVSSLMQQIERVFKHFSGRFYLIRVVMPFFQIIMRRQITFQATYVNNALEYQMFWDDTIVKQDGTNQSWGRSIINDIMPFITHYNKYYKDGNVPTDMEQFENYHAAVLDAYKSGDSLSYFILERILVVQGICSWSNVRHIYDRFFTAEYRGSEWFDYSQMSMIYSLFQIAINSPEPNRETFDILYRECEDWTLRCKGVFVARNSHKANPYKHYKRNVMSWYAAAYCCQSGGDNIAVEGDERCVPAFYSMIKHAFDSRDKELLYNCIENITELVCDYGYIDTGLDLIRYTFALFDSQPLIDEFDAIKIEHRADYHKGLVTYMGESLAAAKKYFPINVDNFIKKELVGLNFPGVDKYKEDVLNYNTGGENIADFITHKFGKFLIWSLIHEDAIGNFAVDAMNSAVDAKSCFEWYDRVVRILFKQLFKVKI